MAEQMRPASKEQAPDPATNYERAKPEKEAGMGRLDNNTTAAPVRSADKVEDAVTHRQESRQINAHDADDQRRSQPLDPQQPDHSMHDEEPTGWDQAPQGRMKPEEKRHPKTEGKGGTP